MVVLVGIGFLAGLITSLSPCILPVLPVVLAAGTSRVSAGPPLVDAAPTRRWRVKSWRPYAVVAGPPPVQDKNQVYTFPATLQPDTFALSGTWDDGMQPLTAGAGAKLELSYQAGLIYLVIGGSGTVGIALDGVATSTIQVSGVPKLYTLASTPTSDRRTLTLTASPGIDAYDFTFG
jgi:hypothetical protein